MLTIYVCEKSQKNVIDCYVMTAECHDTSSKTVSCTGMHACNFSLSV